jgi:hypothetical protein
MDMSMSIEDMEDKKLTGDSIEFKEKVLNHVIESADSFKPLLEMDWDVSEAYDNGDISHDDYYAVLEEIKSVMMDRLR